MIETEDQAIFSITFLAGLVALAQPEETVDPAELSDDEPDAICGDAWTTVELNACYAETLARSEERRAEYLAAALAENTDRPALVEKIEQSASAFSAYRDAECDAVLEDWIEGTIRGVMTLSCEIKLTDQRTHTIWRNWLTYMDSTPPVLPEPQPAL